MTTWNRVLSASELPEGRVTTVAAGHKSIALVHYDGQFSALDNHCPHQGGPLGEGSIENGLLRCPWHGFDYCPLDGKSPGFDDEATTYPLEIRDGEVFIGVQDEKEHEDTVTDVMAKTMVGWGVKHVFGMVGHSNLGLADALRRREQAGELEFIGIRHEGAAAFAASAYGKLTGRPEQRAGEWDVWQTSLHNPDFAAFARNCGALGIRVTAASDLDGALEQAFAYDGPAMVEVMTDPELI